MVYTDQPHPTTTHKASSRVQGNIFVSVLSLSPKCTRQHKVEIGARVALVKDGVVGHKDVRGQLVRERRQKAVIARAKKGCAPQHGAVQRPAVRVRERVSE